jgi:membrane protease YdiL (CAAX protease family)
VLLIFSPVFVIPLLRRQSFETIYLSSRKLGAKILIGIALGLLSVAVFYFARGEPAQLLDWAARAADPRLFVKYFLAVFLEGVALAFLLVRVKWALGLWPALLIPSILFALGHVPKSIDAGDSLGTIAAFCVINTALVTAILYVVQKSRDVIWLGIPHYMMDIAIRAFG